MKIKRRQAKRVLYLLEDEVPRNTINHKAEQIDKYACPAPGTAVRKIMEAMRTACAKAGDSMESCLSNASIISLFLFVGTHFRIFVHKFVVDLRAVYSSPQKLARPLIWSRILQLILAYLCKGDLTARVQDTLSLGPRHCFFFLDGVNTWQEIK